MKDLWLVSLANIKAEVFKFWAVLRPAVLISTVELMEDVGDAAVVIQQDLDLAGNISRSKCFWVPEPGVNHFYFVTLKKKGEGKKKKSCSVLLICRYCSSLLLSELGLYWVRVTHVLAFYTWTEWGDKSYVKRTLQLRKCLEEVQCSVFQDPICRWEI